MINTDNLTEYEPLNAHNILKKITAEEIFRHYVGYDFNLKTCYVSRLRSDDVAPSMNFYYNRQGSLCYKDFGHSQGNCFSFVMNLFGIDYKEALERINYDLRLGLGVERTASEPIRYYNFKKEFKKENTIIQFDVLKYTDKDLAYWNSYGIPEDLLKHFNILKAGNVWLNKKLHWISSEDNPIYVYYFPSSKHCKVYRPFAKPYTNKEGKEVKGKWMSNCDAFDIQGLEQLPERGDLLINTKSLKDVALFRAFGFYAIAPQGEGHFIPKSIQEHLWTRFSRIITVYDNDRAGVEASIKINKEMGSEYWNIPKHFGVKDPTDFYHKYGQQATSELLATIK